MTTARCIITQKCALHSSSIAWRIHNLSTLVHGPLIAPAHHLTPDHTLPVYERCARDRHALLPSDFCYSEDLAQILDIFLKTILSA